MKNIFYSNIKIIFCFTAIKLKYDIYQSIYDNVHSSMSVELLAAQCKDSYVS